MSPRAERQVHTLPAGPVLVLAARPGDELLACGGALALHAEQGDRVHVLVVFDAGPERRAACLQAGRHLGLERYEFWDYPADREPTPDELFFAARLLSVRIRELAPRTLYVPWAGEGRREQRLLARGAGLALEIGEHRLDVFGCEVWTPQEPTRLLDIRPVLGRKQAALREHGSLPEARGEAEGFAPFEWPARSRDEAA